jgi:hypothetical protein
VTSGSSLAVRVVLVSNKVGHDFPTGPLDMIQSWVELKVKDDAGRVVFASGERDERNFLKPGTFLFKAEPVDQYGNLIDRHNLWEMVGVRYRRSLFPGYSDTVEYEVPCAAAMQTTRRGDGAKFGEYSIPVDGAGTWHIQAKLCYRKIDQFLLNYVVGKEAHLTAPVVDIANATATVSVVNRGGPER